MDAIAYQMSFDEGQLALLCANYDRRIDSLDAENKQLQAENAKLREVAGVMAYCMQAERDCDGCRMNGAAGTIAEPAGCDVLLDLLRELGVYE